MDIRTIKLCPLYEYCPRMQCYDDEQIYADNEPFIYLFNVMMMNRYMQITNHLYISILIHA